MEKSPSPVYGARLELVYALIAHRGFESLLLRQKKIAENLAFCRKRSIRLQNKQGRLTLLILLY